MAERPIGVLVMAYGTASGPDDVERYYTDIRGGRAPSPEHLRELLDRYAAIGNRFPLLEITSEQAHGLEEELNRSDPGAFRSYLGMKHSPPFIAEAVVRMRADGIERAIGIVMAPHWSGMSVETYVERVRAEAGDDGPFFTFVRSYHDDPAFIGFLSGRVAHSLGELMPAEREGATVILSAHSLPVRTLDDGSQRCLRCDWEMWCAESCRYRDGLAETADLVAAELGLARHTIAWQSAGRTDDPWWGPPIEDVIADLGSAGAPAIVVCSAGFVADHLEILYDLDVEAREIAEQAGMRFVRTAMPNADPAFVRVLADVVRKQLAIRRTM
jgi:protoporphyrin/coproporphyrin ferrochelatase